MASGFVIIAIIIGIALYVVAAMLMDKVAIAKGYGEGSHIFAICFFLGIFGYLYVIALPDKITQRQNQRIIELLSKEDK